METTRQEATSTVIRNQRQSVESLRQALLDIIEEMGPVWARKVEVKCEAMRLAARGQAGTPRHVLLVGECQGLERKISEFKAEKRALTVLLQAAVSPNS